MKKINYNYFKFLTISLFYLIFIKFTFIYKSDINIILFINTVKY